MKYLVTASEMKQYDINTTEKYGMPSLVLMERAALAVTAELEKLPLYDDAVLVVCGTGNNGADGLAVARLLFLAGRNVEIVLVGNLDKMTPQCRKQLEIVQAYGLSVSDHIKKTVSFSAVVDAVFGVGLSRMVEGCYAELLSEMNSLGGTKVAVDMPSGISSDTGAVLGTAFRADITVTFGFEKRGLHLWPGNTYSGRVVCASIGITPESFCGRMPQTMALEDPDLPLLLQGRPSHSNKGTYGRVLLIAGCRQMAGAAILSAKAAYTAGCGLVKVYTAEENRTSIYTGIPEAVLGTYTEQDYDPNDLKQSIEWADAVVCGPGLGQSNTAARIVQDVLRYTKGPLLLDADALNLVAVDRELLSHIPEQTIVTPHLCEMSRLTGKPVSAIQMELLVSAEALAREFHLICVLKDERTVVAGADGTCYLNLSGNQGMATAGSGDVLSGIIASLLAQGMEPHTAAACGVFLHGRAGDTIRGETGDRSMMASDLIRGLREYLAGQILQQ